MRTLKRKKGLNVNLAIQVKKRIIEMDKKLLSFTLLFISFIYTMFVWLNKLMEINLYQLNLAFLPNGFYTIKLNNNGQIDSYKFIIQK